MDHIIVPTGLIFGVIIAILAGIDRRRQAKTDIEPRLREVAHSRTTSNPAATPARASVASSSVTAAPTSTRAVVDLTALAATHRPEDNAALVNAYRSSGSVGDIEWFRRMAPHAIFARLECPHCGVRFASVASEGITKINKTLTDYSTCSRCRQRFCFVRGVDGREHLMRPDDAKALGDAQPGSPAAMSLTIAPPTPLTRGPIGGEWR